MTRVVRRSVKGGGNLIIGAAFYIDGVAPPNAMVDPPLTVRVLNIPGRLRTAYCSLAAGGRSRLALYARSMR